MHPYVDPGSGALLWQTAVAAFVGLLFFIRRVVSWIKSNKADPRR